MRAVGVGAWPAERLRRGPPPHPFIGTQLHTNVYAQLHTHTYNTHTHTHTHTRVCPTLSTYSVCPVCRVCSPFSTSERHVLPHAVHTRRGTFWVLSSNWVCLRGAHKREGG